MEGREGGGRTKNSSKLLPNPPAICCLHEIWISFKPLAAPLATWNQISDLKTRAWDATASQILQIHVKVTFCMFYLMTQALFTQDSALFIWKRKLPGVDSVCSGASISLLYPSVLVGPVGVWRSQECETGSHAHSVSRKSVRLRGQCMPHRPSHKRGSLSISMLSGDTGTQIGSLGLAWGQRELQQESSVPLLLSSLLLYLPLFFFWSLPTLLIFPPSLLCWMTLSNQ